MWTKFMYELDKLIKRGLGAQMILLFATVIIITLIGSVILTSINNSPFDVMLWDSFKYIIDPGTVTAHNLGDTNLSFFFILTFVGLLIWSAVVAILNEGLRNKLDALQNGIVQLQEKGHVVILGWGDEVPALLEEYSHAGIKTVVILSEHDREDIMTYAPEGMELIARCGNPLEQRVLSLLCIDQCRALVIIADNDMYVLKIVLAIKKLFKSLAIPLVAVVHEAGNKDVVESLQEDEFRIRCINKWEILASLTAQGIVFSGVASVYDDLFSINGNKIITKPAAPYSKKGMKSLAADFIKQNDVLLGYVSTKNESILGYATNECPPTDSELVLLSTDGTYEEPPLLLSSPNKQNNILILADGAQAKIAPYIEQYKEYIPNQYLMSFEEVKNSNANFEGEESGTLPFLQHFITEHNITKVLLLSEDEEEDVDVIALLIFFRHLRQKTRSTLSMLTLLSSARNRELVAYDNSDDFIVSGKLIGAMLGQASLYPKLDAVFTDLLDADGLELGQRDIPEELIGLSFEQAFIKLAAKDQVLIGLCNDRMHLRPDKKMILQQGDALLIIADFI